MIRQYDGGTKVKARHLAILAVVGAVSVAVAQPTAPPGPPDRIESDRGDRAGPLWISVDRAIDQEGRLATELFHPQERAQLQRELAGQVSQRQAGVLGGPEDPCRDARGMFAEYYVSNPALGDLVEHSKVAFSARVQGGKPGFYRGQPRHLYRVKVDEVWLDNGNLRSGDTAFVAFEEAQIRVGEDWLCVRGPRYPARPMPGKRILVFSHQDPRGEQPVFSPMDVELFFETKEGLSAPGHLVTELESPHWNDLEAAVAELVAPSGGGR